MADCAFIFGLFFWFIFSVVEPEPVEPKLFWDLEPEPDPEPKINFNKNFLQSVWRMLE